MPAKKTNASAAKAKPKKQEEASHISSFGTGGGGIRFEHHCQTEYIIRFLCKAEFPILPKKYKKIKFISLQARHTVETDDILVCMEDAEGDEHNLLVQVKHKLTFTKSDKQTKEALALMWEDYKKDPKNTKRNAFLFLVGGKPSQTILDVMVPFFEIAKSSSDLNDFIKKLNKEQKKKVDIFRGMLQEIENGVEVERQSANESSSEDESESEDESKKEDKQEKIPDELLFNFIKLLNLDFHDYDYGERSELHLLSVMESGLKKNYRNKKEEILKEILVQVGKWNQNAATLTEENIPEKFKKYFKSGNVTLDIDLFNCPVLKTADKFVQRKKYLQQVNERLKTHAKPRSPVSKTVVAGMSGMGKTSLVHYIMRENINQYSVRVWFNAASEDQLKEDYIKFVKQISKEEFEDFDAIKERVKRFFERNVNWLIVYDNYDNVQQSAFLESYIPRSGGQVLITTTNQDFFPDSVVMGKIDSEEKEEQQEAEDLFFNYGGADAKRSFSGKNRTYLTELLVELDYFPLAIAQAGSYFNHNHSGPVEEYVGSCRRYKEEARLLFESAIDVDHISAYATWALIEEKLKEKNPNALLLLKVAAYFNADNIPKILLENLSSSYARSVAFLAQYSLLTLNRSDEYFSIHRVLQKIIRLKIQQECNESATRHNEYLEKSLFQLWYNFQYRRKDREKLKKIVLHVKECLRFIFEEKFEKKLAVKSIFELSNLSYNLATYLLEDNLDMEAFRYIEKAKNILEDAVGDRDDIDPKVEELHRKILKKYAEVCRRIGKSKEAKEAEGVLNDFSVFEEQDIFDQVKSYRGNKEYNSALALIESMLEDPDLEDSKKARALHYKGSIFGSKINGSNALIVLKIEDIRGCTPRQTIRKSQKNREIAEEEVKIKEFYEKAKESYSNAIAIKKAIGESMEVARTQSALLRLEGAMENNDAAYNELLDEVFEDGEYIRSFLEREDPGEAERMLAEDAAQYLIKEGDRDRAVLVLEKLIAYFRKNREQRSDSERALERLEKKLTYLNSGDEKEREGVQDSFRRIAMALDPLNAEASKPVLSSTSSSSSSSSSSNSSSSSSSSSSQSSCTSFARKGSQEESLKAALSSVKPNFLPSAELNPASIKASMLLDDDKPDETEILQRKGVKNKKESDENQDPVSEGSRQKRAKVVVS